MTDKVQKIREEIERLKGWNNNVRNSTRHMTLQEEDFNRGKHSSYLEILNFIDSLQEEPVGEDLGEVANKYGKDTFVNECMENGVCDNYDLADAFNAGDWVVRKDGETFRNGSNFAQIQSIELDGVMCYLDTGRWLYPSEIRLWTINDAQNGDILVSAKNKPFIYNGYFNRHSVGAYCGIDANNDLVTKPNYSWTMNKDIRPATKEQSDLLSQKLKEADYGIG